MENKKDENLNKSIYLVLVEKILSGELKSGTKVSELALAKELKVSRTPVHNAVLKLIKDGLVEQVGNKRPFVTSFDASKIDQLYNMRFLLECEAVRQATLRVDKKTLTYLRERIMEEKEAFRKDPNNPGWADSDHEFHSIIYGTCGNDYIMQDIERYWQIMRILLKVHVPDGMNVAPEEHLGILDAIESGDPDIAAKRMADHIMPWKEYFMRFFESKTL